MKIDRFSNHTMMAIHVKWSHRKDEAITYMRRCRVERNTGVPRFHSLTGIRLGFNSIWPVMNASAISLVDLKLNRDNNTQGHSYIDDIHWPNIVHYATLSDCAQVMP